MFSSMDPNYPGYTGIRSPNFPNDYDDGLNCGIKFGPSLNFTCHFTTLELEAPFDILMVNRINYSFYNQLILKTIRFYFCSSYRTATNRKLKLSTDTTQQGTFHFPSTNQSCLKWKSFRDQMRKDQYLPKPVQGNGKCIVCLHEFLSKILDDMLMNSYVSVMKNIA